LKFVDQKHVYLTRELEKDKDIQEPEYVIKGLETYRNQDELKKIILPVIRQCVMAFLMENRSVLRDQDELKLTILITWSFIAERPTMAVFASYLLEQKAMPCRIEFCNYVRSSKDVKDSLWVQLREQLETKKPTDISEIVMYDAEGKISEGLSSNFFVIMDNQIYTAQRGEVLWGTVLSLVIDLCRKEGIPVVYDHPRLSDIDRWQGAFITSTSRLIMSVTELIVRETGIHRVFERVDTIEHLQKIVKECIGQRSSPLF
jgi:branched-subunit amino acid aminotransferase/4-amino-4-deoxychorismate lyase